MTLMGSCLPVHQTWLSGHCTGCGRGIEPMVFIVSFNQKLRLSFVMLSGGRGVSDYVAEAVVRLFYAGVGWVKVV